MDINDFYGHAWRDYYFECFDKGCNNVKVLKLIQAGFKFNLLNF